MWQINKEFEDFMHPIGKGWVYLNPDQPLNPYTIKYPIIWTGYVGGSKVRIIQQGQLATTLDNFDFIEYPAKYSNLKSDIVRWIDECLKILD